MLLFLVLGEVLPHLALGGRQALPLLADGLGEVGLALLLRGALGGRCALVLRLLAVLAAFAAEEDERVLRALDVVLVSLLWPALDGIAAARRLAPPVRGGRLRDGRLYWNAGANAGGGGGVNGCGGGVTGVQWEEGRE